MKYAEDNGFPNPTFFIDDGVSGVTFDRPGWNEMIRLAEAGKVKTVIVKDMSRMGRDYLKVGYYTESVSTQGVVNPGPELMYRTVRWGECSYPCLMDGTPGQTYKVRLHFAELDKNTTEGKRIFSVNVNGKPVVTDLDVYKEAGGSFKALVKETSGIKADSNNMITITLPKARKGAPQICGFEILPQ